MADHRGTNGNDTLDQRALGLPDFSNLFGLGGDDNLSVQFGTAIGGPGNDRITGTGQFSGAAYWDSPAGIVADLAAGTVQDGHGSTDFLVAVDQLYGGGHDDVMLGDGDANKFHPNGGHDRLDGRGGIDAVWFDGSLSDLVITVSTDGRSAQVRRLSRPGDVVDMVDIERLETRADAAVTIDSLIDPFVLGSVGLVGADAQRWNAASSKGTPVTVSFSFMVAAPAGDIAQFRAFDASQRDAVRAILADTAALTGLSFREVDEAVGALGQMRFGVSAQSVTKGQAFMPGEAAAAGDVLMDIDSVVDLTPGGEGNAALRHEIGHALGLRHPRNVDAGDAWTDQFRVQDDHTANTVMSGVARDDGLWRTGWGMLDLVALRSLYGVVAVAQGDDVHRLTDAAATGLGLVVDDGGFDRIDVSAVSVGARLDLRPGTLSSVGRGRQGEVVRDNIGIAVGTVIEDAVGSSWDDVIVGNTAGNRLQGNSGNDWIDGGAGNDVAAYSGPRSAYRVQVIPGQWAVSDAAGIDGRDTLLGVEAVAFSDVTLPLTYQRALLAPGPGGSPDFLFDPVYYLLANTSDAPVDSIDQVLGHYRGVGGPAGRKPTSWFDAAYYSARWADLSPLSLDPVTLFAHFNLFGVWEGRSPGPGFDRFDGARYLRDYPDVAAYVNASLADFLGSATNGAIAHFILFGANEQRQAFDTLGSPIEFGYVL